MELFIRKYIFKMVILEQQPPLKKKKKKISKLTYNKLILKYPPFPSLKKYELIPPHPPPPPKKTKKKRRKPLIVD